MMLKRLALVFLFSSFLVFLWTHFSAREGFPDEWNHYQVLGLEYDPLQAVSQEAVKNAYKKMSLLWHPDQNAAKGVDTTARMAR